MGSPSYHGLSLPLPENVHDTFVAGGNDDPDICLNCEVPANKCRGNSNCYYKHLYQLKREEKKKKMKTKKTHTRIVIEATIELDLEHDVGYPDIREYRTYVEARLKDILGDAYDVKVNSAKTFVFNGREDKEDGSVQV